MSTLILQHESDTPPGSTIQWLERRRMSFRIIHVQSEPLPQPESFQNLIICGGSMNVMDGQIYPWLQDEKKLISTSLKANKKIVGLCLGAQLLAEALGATVAELPHWEIGWHDVLMQGHTLKAFHWHKYGFSLPKSASSLGKSAACPQQGFYFGELAAGLQFHPEADEAWIKMALEDYQKKESPYAQSSSEITEMTPKYLEAAKNWYFEFLDQRFNK